MRVYIDGKSGTTGLRIASRLACVRDIELITLADSERRDTERRRHALNSCDICFLCLPDDAAREAVSMVENENTVIIDASTAHRTESGWAYGFPELSPSYRSAIRESRRIAVPGCHASGFVALVYPLTEAGILSPSALLSCFSLTGYSGGGKKMIAEYEDGTRSPLYAAPRQYALAQSHKHLPEMAKITGLEHAPVFCPTVADFYSGMEVTVPLFSAQLNGAGIDDVRRIYNDKYHTGIVSYKDEPDEKESGFLSASALCGLDRMEISVFGNDERMILTARFDNLGKGASGAAIQCMNIASGRDEATGLTL